LVFRWHGKALVISGFSDGRLYLLDAQALGGADHKTSLFRSEPVATRARNYDGAGFRGTFASWPDVDGDKRWFYAPVIGPADSGIQAFRMSEANGQFALEPMWTASGMISPDPPVIANGLIFALSTGNSPRLAKKNGHLYSGAERNAMTKPAVLYAIDDVTGQQLYSSGQTIPTPARSNGLAVANARVYFSGEDGRVYCFGLPKTQPQLAEQQ
jgi:outer membrane protein assembly factor BamB